MYDMVTERPNTEWLGTYNPFRSHGKPVFALDQPMQDKLEFEPVDD